MTTQIVFQKGTRRTAIRIIGDNVLFIDLNTNMLAPIEGLKFHKEGVIKEYPDLKDDQDWKQKSIQRFVDKVKELPSETKKVEWIINEMRLKDYKPLYKQRNGFRAEKIK